LSQDKSTMISAFYNELSLHFQWEHIEHGPPKNDCLPILLDGSEIGFVTPDGAVIMKQESLGNEAAHMTYLRAGIVAAEVYGYMQQMAYAPPLQASSLHSPYKLLADFNGYVLGGMESPYGGQFTTWQWTYEKTGLTLGHYWRNDYSAAKEDFARRSGLVQKDRLFTGEQLTQMYRCAANMLDTGVDLSYEQEETIKGILEQIRELVPDVTERIGQTREQEMEAPDSPTM